MYRVDVPHECGLELKTDNLKDDLIEGFRKAREGAGKQWDRLRNRNGKGRNDEEDAEAEQQETFEQTHPHPSFYLSLKTRMDTMEEELLAQSEGLLSQTERMNAIENDQKSIEEFMQKQLEEVNQRQEEELQEELRQIERGDDTPTSTLQHYDMEIEKLKDEFAVSHDSLVKIITNLAVGQREQREQQNQWEQIELRNTALVEDMNKARADIEGLRKNLMGLIDTLQQNNRIPHQSEDGFLSDRTLAAQRVSR